MGKALLTYGYGLKNAGDMAITLGAIELLKKKYEVTVLSRFDSSHPEYEKSKNFILSKFADVEVFPSPFKLNRNAGLITKFKDHINGGLQIAGLVKSIRIDELIGEADLVVFNGGNLFRCESFSDFARLLALMHPLQKARKMGVPYIIFPQSASHINWVGKKILQGELSKASKIWTREDHSFDYLSQKFDLDNMEKTIDLAFFLKATRSKREFSNSDGSKNIAVTVRGHTVGDLQEFDSLKRESIKKSITQTLIKLNKSYNASFNLVIQTEKDRDITNEIYGEFRQDLSLKITEEYDPIKLIEIYSNCNLLVGMRLHSIILALSTGTPAVGLFDDQWGLKNPGLMQKFDLPYKFINDNKDQSLTEAAAELLDREESIRESILKLIENEDQKISRFLDTFNN